jgi:endogenous inhibitor of DNA gyrase (YacG/DUF329 family)
MKNNINEFSDFCKEKCKSVDTAAYVAFYNCPGEMKNCRNN